jgi:signal transduction histidine kinase
MEVIHQVFDIRSCVNQVLQLFTAEIIKKEITLNSEIDPKIPSILISDEQKIRQIRKKEQSKLL